MLDRCEIVPTTNPAPVIAMVAAGCVRFTTFGTAIGPGAGAGPVETTRFTADPAATPMPAAGFWLITRPAATVALDCCVTAPTTSPAPVIAVLAAACAWFTTFGTVTGPVVTSHRVNRASAVPWPATATESVCGLQSVIDDAKLSR